jgi:hypothetical protein
VNIKAGTHGTMGVVDRSRWAVHPARAAPVFVSPSFRRVCLPSRRSRFSPRLIFGSLLCFSSGSGPCRTTRVPLSSRQGTRWGSPRFCCATAFFHPGYHFPFSPSFSQLRVGAWTDPRDSGSSAGEACASLTHTSASVGRDV